MSSYVRIVVIAKSACAFEDGVGESTVSALQPRQGNLPPMSMGIGLEKRAGRAPAPLAISGDCGAAPGRERPQGGGGPSMTSWLSAATQMCVPYAAR